MNNQRIYLSAPDMGDLEMEFLLDAYKSNWIAPVGPHCDAFENELSEACQRKYCAVLNSGTSAIHLALLLQNIQPGDVVLCQSFTFIGTVNPVIYCNAIPYFIDSEPDTWNMDPHLLEQAILNLAQQNIVPKAILPVHLYGMPARIQEILAVGNKYQIPVIEDAAESIGARAFQKPCGSFGALSILSFNGNKIITTSGGGALLGDDEAAIQEARFLATQARDPAPHYEHTRIGYNYRMSNLLAALGRAQLRSLDTRILKRRNIHSIYQSYLKQIDGIHFLDEPTEHHFSNRWLTTILIDPKVFSPHTRDQLIRELETHHIESRPLWKPMHLQPVFKNCQSITNGVSQYLFENGLCLPSGSGIPEHDIHRIAQMITNFLHSR